MTPPVPARLARRPTVAGLVVPWISVQHADGGAALGAVHASRQDACLTRGWCQICGEPHTHRIVLFARPSDMDRGYVAEPGMHPECGAYTAQACPMLNGAMRHYRTHPRDLTGAPCVEPGCDCAGWVPEDTDQTTARAGHPADAYAAVWIRDRDYRVAVDENRSPIGVALPPHPLKIRPVRSASPIGDAEMTRAALPPLGDM